MNGPAPADPCFGRDEEVRALRAEIERLHAEAGRNEAVFRRTLERELAVLDAQTLPELFALAYNKFVTLTRQLKVRVELTEYAV